MSSSPALLLSIPSAIVTGLDVLLVDLLLVALIFGLLRFIFNTRNLHRPHIPGRHNNLSVTNFGPLSLSLIGHPRRARPLSAFSLLVVFLAALSGFGIKGLTRRRYAHPAPLYVATFSPPRNVSSLVHLLAYRNGTSLYSGAALMFSNVHKCVQFEGDVKKYYPRAMPSVHVERFYALTDPSPSSDCVTPATFLGAVPLYVQDAAHKRIKECIVDAVTRIDMVTSHNISGFQMETFRATVASPTCLFDSEAPVLWCTTTFGLVTSCVYHARDPVEGGLLTSIRVRGTVTVGTRMAGSLDYSSDLFLEGLSERQRSQVLVTASALTTTSTFQFLSQAALVSRLTLTERSLRRDVGSSKATELGLLFLVPVGLLLGLLCVLGCTAVCCGMRTAAKNKAGGFEGSGPYNAVADLKGLVRVMRNELLQKRSDMQDLDSEVFGEDSVQRFEVCLKLSDDQPQVELWPASPATR